MFLSFKMCNVQYIGHCINCNVWIVNAGTFCILYTKFHRSLRLKTISLPHCRIMSICHWDLFWIQHNYAVAWLAIYSPCFDSLITQWGYLVVRLFIWISFVQSKKKRKKKECNIIASLMWLMMFYMHDDLFGICVRQA